MWKSDGNDSHKFYQIELTAHKSLKSSRWHFIVFHILAPGNIFLGVKIGFTLVTFIHWIFDYLKGEKKIEKSVIYLALKQLKVAFGDEKYSYIQHKHVFLFLYKLKNDPCRKINFILIYLVFQISDKLTIAVLKQVNIYIFIFYI